MIEEGHMIGVTHRGMSGRSPAVFSEQSRGASSRSLAAVGFLAVALVGCATGSALRPLDPSHPASPAAAEAAIPEPATMLRDSLPAGKGEPSEPPAHLGHTMHGGPRTGSATKVSPRVAEYTCPMHHDVRHAGPGRCPKCGMTLVRTAGDDAETEGRQ